MSLGLAWWTVGSDFRAASLLGLFVSNTESRHDSRAERIHSALVSIHSALVSIHNNRTRNPFDPRQKEIHRTTLFYSDTSIILEQHGVLGFASCTYQRLWCWHDGHDTHYLLFRYTRIERANHYSYCHINIQVKALGMQKGMAGRRWVDIPLPFLRSTEENRELCGSYAI